LCTRRERLKRYFTTLTYLPAEAYVQQTIGRRKQLVHADEHTDARYSLVPPRENKKQNTSINTFPHLPSKQAVIPRLPAKLRSRSALPKETYGPAPTRPNNAIPSARALWRMKKDPTKAYTLSWVGSLSTNKWAPRRRHRVSGHRAGKRHYFPKKKVKDIIFSKLLGIGLNALNTFQGTLI
jgi:hypothetical protein